MRARASETIAYIDAQRDFDRVGFAETVAVNHCIPVAVFGSIEDAKIWLRRRSEDVTGEEIFRGDSD